jgi:hypothetical protein
MWSTLAIVLLLGKVEDKDYGFVVKRGWVYCVIGGEHGDYNNRKYLKLMEVSISYPIEINVENVGDIYMAKTHLQPLKPSM